MPHFDTCMDDLEVASSIAKTKILALVWITLKSVTEAFLTTLLCRYIQFSFGLDWNDI